MQRLSIATWIPVLFLGCTESRSLPSNDEPAPQPEPPCEQLSFFVDADGDGFGDALTAELACEAPPGFVAQPGDCDDFRSDVHPGQPELCNGLDDDCNSLIDDDATDSSTFFADADGDGFGDPAAAVKACTVPEGHTTNDQDCDDTSAAARPGGTEICDGVDNDCDPGTPDEGTAIFIDSSNNVTQMATDLRGTADAPNFVRLDEPGELRICAGTWFTRLEIAADVDIVGPSGSSVTVIDGGERGSVLAFYTDGVHSLLKGLTIQNGTGDIACVPFSETSPGGGGVCALANTTIVGTDLKIRDNRADFGAGLYQRAGDITLTEVEIVDNDANTDIIRRSEGGGVNVARGTFRLSKSLVSGNHAREGSGMNFERDTIGIIDDVEIVENGLTPLGSGGGIYSSSTDLRVANSLVARNFASSGGGLKVIFTDALMHLVNTLVVDNTATFDGAGAQIGGSTSQRHPTTELVCEGAPGVVSGFHNNVAESASGAAVEVRDGLFRAIDCDFGDTASGTNNEPRDIDRNEVDYLADANTTCTVEGCDP